MFNVVQYVLRKKVLEVSVTLLFSYLDSRTGKFIFIFIMMWH